MGCAAKFPSVAICLPSLNRSRKNLGRDDPSGLRERLSCAELHSLVTHCTARNEDADRTEETMDSTIASVAFASYRAMPGTMTVILSLNIWLSGAQCVCVAQSIILKSGNWEATRK
ncbi:MAG: hypothetical protein U0R49_11185 [Fimbriimonadales bacterium]